MTTAREIQARIKNGLTLAGFLDGQYQWIGTKKQWQDSEHEIENHERWYIDAYGEWNFMTL